MSWSKEKRQECKLMNYIPLHRKRKIEQQETHKTNPERLAFLFHCHLRVTPVKNPAIIHVREKSKIVITTKETFCGHL